METEIQPVVQTGALVITTPNSSFSMEVLAHQISVAGRRANIFLSHEELTELRDALTLQLEG